MLKIHVSGFKKKRLYVCYAEEGQRAWSLMERTVKHLWLGTCRVAASAAEAAHARRFVEGTLNLIPPK